MFIFSEFFFEITNMLFLIHMRLAVLISSSNFWSKKKKLVRVLHFQSNWPKFIRFNFDISLKYLAKKKKIFHLNKDSTRTYVNLVEFCMKLKLIIFCKIYIMIHKKNHKNKVHIKFIL